MTQTPNPPAGWYPQGSQERWWDGTAWSDNFRPLSTDNSGGYPPMFQALPQQPGPVAYGDPQAGQPGQQPYGQTGQPAYGQQPYYSAPVQKSHVARNLLIGFAVFFVLIAGGCAVGVAVLANRVDDVVNDDTPGGPNNPLEITAGEGFEVSGFEYSDGWSIVADDLGDADVVDLQVHNGRDSSDYAFITIKLLDGNVVASSISCTGPNGERISQDTTVTLDCYSSDPLATTYDKVTIQDSF